MHEHLRSYVGQARVALHSAVRQLELAEAAFRSVPVNVGLNTAASDITELREQLIPLRDKLVHTHMVVVERT